MSAAVVLDVQPRETKTKGQVRNLREAGWVPGVIYGGDALPENLSLSLKQLGQELHRAGFFSRLFETRIGKRSQHFVVRDIQFHPVTDTPLHVDLMRISKDSRITVSVPFRFVNEEQSPGIKRGGVLNVVLHTLPVSTLARKIPEEFVIDLGDMHIGQSIHLRDIDLPKGVQPLHPEQDLTIATIASPSGMVDLDAAEDKTTA